MNDLVTAVGLPPVIAMVLDQYPDESESDKVTAMAERYLQASGMQTIPATYRREKAGAVWNVSPWEGHPNAIAHALFAHALQPAIEQTSTLQKYHR
jgi:hypothetical protein